MTLRWYNPRTGWELVERVDPAKVRLCDVASQCLALGICCEIN